MPPNRSILERCRFFEHFQPKHLDKFAELGTQVDFTNGQIIFREDDASTLFYVIVSGRVALEASLGGTFYPIQTLYPGDELGWSAMLERPKQFQARALEAVATIAFEAAALRKACDGNVYFAREFHERMLVLLAERLQNTRLQLLALAAEARPRAAASPT